MDTHTPTFSSERSYWDFAESVRRHSRYVWSSETQQFLSALKASWQDRVMPLGPDNAILWRAQIGCCLEPEFDCEGNHVNDRPVPYTADRMKPRTTEAVEGRANPKGIPAFYAASDRDTAIAEVRPWVGADVSVARCKLLKDLRVLNCAATHGRKSCSYIFRKPRADEIPGLVWRSIDDAFARPLSDSDQSADYAPTQVLAEYFKHNGFDGIAFKSSVGEGHNLAIFDPDSVCIEHRQVVEIGSVSYGYYLSGGVRFNEDPDMEEAKARIGPGISFTIE